jgi:hypothetical protein
MSNSFHGLRRIKLAVGLGLCLAAGGNLAAQEGDGLIPGLGSLSHSEIEFREARLSLQQAALKNEALARKLALADETIKSLTESLAVANGEAEEFRRIAAELKLRMEAVGIDASSGDRKKLEQSMICVSSRKRKTSLLIACLRLRRW